jgi:putative SOS response-associated peptidase YedK
MISLSGVCTAYEIGRKGNRVPTRTRDADAWELSSSAEIRIVRPTLAAPVIMPDGELRDMVWGFRRKFRGVKGSVFRTIVNSREDKLDSSMWREAFRQRRCLIPAIAFYEWVEGPAGKAVPLRFTREDDGWLIIAGIWEEGENGPCYSMITTEPSAFVSKVHDRMPAVLEEEQIDPFLRGELHKFGPSSLPLRHFAADNFLKPEKPRATEGDQGFLF